ncbi:MAG: hypothetical protein Q9195_001955 [Heterodermia aff. obscurata]
MLPQLFLYSAVVSTVLGMPLEPDVASAKILLPTKDVTSAWYRSIRPPDPPGFQTRVYQPKPEPSNILSPLGVFFSVLIYFHQRGQRQGWTQPAELELYKIEPTRITISIEAFKHAEDPTIPVLTIGHVMLALYAGVAYMSEIRSFYSTKMDVSIFGKPIGVLWILGMGRYAHDETIANQTAQSISISSNNNNDDILNTTGNDDVPDSGVYTDTLIPGIALDYAFTPRKVKSEDIFTCLMEAFLIVTHDAGHNVDFIHLDAISAAFPPRLALNIHHTNRLVPKMDVVADLLWLIAQFYATNKRFDEMDFEMIVKASGYPPSTRAAGFFMRL